MPRIEYRPSRPAPARILILLSRVLTVLALALVLVIAAGTFYALVFRPPGAPPPVSAPGPAPSPDASVFTGLGRLRCPTADPDPALVILQASFPWFPGDRPFSEELVSRLRELRSLTAAYFAALKAEDLHRKGEAQVKAELLERYNALLRLGKIETLYFNEYMVLE